MCSGLSLHHQGPLPGWPSWPCLASCLTALVVLWSGALVAQPASRTVPAHPEVPSSLGPPFRSWLACGATGLAAADLPEDAWVEAGGEQLAVTTTDFDEPWHTTIYIDAPLATPEGVRRAIRSLTAATNRLVALGNTRIVVASPTATLHQPPTRDAETLRLAFAELEARHLESGQLIWHRERSRADAGTADRDAAFHAEATMRRDRSDDLSEWLTRSPHGSPTAVFYVGDGFDLEATRFYGDELVSAHGRSPADAAFARLLQQIEDSVSLFLALRLGDDREVLHRPGRALTALSDSGRGSVLRSARQLAKQLDELARCVVVRSDALQGDLPAGPRADLRSATLVTGHGRQALLPLPTENLLPTGDPELSAAAYLILLEPVAAPAPHRLRLEALASPRIHSVEFHQGANHLGTVDQPPFRLDLAPGLALGLAPGAEISATGRDLGGALVARQVTLLATPASYSALRIVETEATATGARVTLEVNRPWSDAATVSAHWGGEGIDPAPGPRTPAGLRTIHLVRPKTVERNDLLIRIDWNDGSSGEDAVFVDPQLAERLAVHSLELVVYRGLGETDSSPVVTLHGERLEPTLISELDREPLELALVVDTSGSMKFSLEEIKTQLASFIAQLSADDRPFLVDFSHQPRLIRPSDSASDSLISALAALTSDGSTELYAAARYALGALEPTADSTSALMIITDDGVRDDRHLADELLEQALLRAVPIYVVQIASAAFPRATPALLDARLASKTSGRLLRHVAATDLSSTLHQIELELRARLRLQLERPLPWTREDLEALRVRVGGQRTRFSLPPRNQGSGAH